MKLLGGLKTSPTKLKSLPHNIEEISIYEDLSGLDCWIHVNFTAIESRNCSYRFTVPRATIEAYMRRIEAIKEKKALEK